MNRYQKLVQKQYLNNEKAVINALKGTYESAYEDIIKRIESLDASISALQKAYDSIEDDEIGDLAKAFLSKNRTYTPEEAQATLQSMLQSKVYQRNYQKALEKQIDGVLGNLLDGEYKTISEYLQGCYEDGFVGTMFDLQGQGIPLCFPIDQEAVVRAVQLDSPIKQGLYNHLGENVDDLKKIIASEISRGISTGMSYSLIARNISANMMGTYENPGGSYAYALRIARTEGHRIQVQGTMDACYKAKEKGADVVKQWDSTLDGRTRESHQQVDGEIRELDEKFSNGLMFPGDPSGGAAEVVNCRCALLQRARWALDEAELEHLKERAEYFGLDKADEFEDFKKKYLKAAENSSLTNPSKDSRITSPDIQIGRSVGAKAKNYDIELPNKEIVHLTEGTRITNIETIAGKGRNRQIDELDILLEKFGGSALEWQKKKGLGYVDYEGESYLARLHWYEEPTVGRHKWKVKPDADGNWFIEDD